MTWLRPASEDPVNTLPSISLSDNDQMECCRSCVRQETIGYRVVIVDVKFEGQKLKRVVCSQKKRVEKFPPVYFIFTKLVILS